MSASRQICILSRFRLCLVSISLMTTTTAAHGLACIAGTTATFYENTPEDNSLSSADESYQTARGTTPEVEHKERPASSVQPLMPSPEWSRRSSLGMSDTDDSHSESGMMLDPPGYQSPPPLDERLAEFRNERRYRMLLQHEFHPSRTRTILSNPLLILIHIPRSITTALDANPDPSRICGLPLKARRRICGAVQCVQASRVVRWPHRQYGFHRRLRPRHDRHAKIRQAQRCSAGDGHDSVVADVTEQPVADDSESAVLFAAARRAQGSAPVHRVDCVPIHG